MLWAFARGCSKLLNSCVPDSLDERALNLPASATCELGRREALQNNTLCINAAKALGCSLADVTPEDIFEGKVRPFLQFFFLSADRAIGLQALALAKPSLVMLVTILVMTRFLDYRRRLSGAACGR